MSLPATDCNLLFGILGLQMSFFRRNDLVAALNSWARDKSRPLGDILVENGVLAAERRCELEAVVQAHVQAHGNDPQQSLAAALSNESVQNKLLHIDDPLVQSTIASATTAQLSNKATVQREVTNDSPRYRKLHSHARGGLGEVFIAEDTELHREVALKEILRQCADDPESRNRFLIEAEVTGGLEHPGIVPIYGLGKDADGRPYYAMRFIQGESLKSASESFHAADVRGRDPAERRLAFRQLLRRFVDACNAVAYAHSRSVLHRDLKPANIMLGKFGETLVVDWGLAKAGVRQRAAEDPAQELTVGPSLRPGSGSDEYATQAGVALGTPTYMSPEQAAGRIDELGPATDIYGLGATLYVLLTGCRPYRGDSSDEVLAQVRQGRFPAPSEVKADVSPALDAVCRKAMSFLPADRYSSALELAVDIEHWLADEPVSAYAEPVSVRAGRWARRHRTAVVAAGVLLVSTVVALTITTALVVREQRQTAEQKRFAEHNFELARDLSYHGVDLVASREAAFAAIPELQIARKELLRSAARAFREYLARNPEDPELRQRTAKVYRFAANVQQFANELKTAEPLYHDSIEILEGLAQQFPQAVSHRTALVETLRDYAAVQAKQGALRAATDSLRRALDLADQLVAAEPKRAGNCRNQATSLLDLSGLQYALGLTVDSGMSATRAVELFRGLVALPANESHPYNPVLLAAAMNRVALSQREAGKLAEAADNHLDAAQMLQEFYKKRPDSVVEADVRHFIARCRLGLGETLTRVPERHKTAGTNLDFAVAQWEKLATAYSKSPVYREYLGLAYQSRAQLRADTGLADEARKDFERSRELLEACVQEFPDMPALRGDLGRTYLGLARLARRGNDAAAAGDCLAKAIDALRFAVDKSPDHAQDRRSLEEARAEQQKGSLNRDR